MRHQVAAMLAVCCEAFVIAEAAAGTGGAIEPNPDAPVWLAELLAFIEAEHTHPITLKDLAKRSDRTREHICRVFQRHLAASPLEVLNRRRLQTAAYRLHATSSPVAEVAAASGFNDVRHFQRLFRRVVGYTPHAYRQNSDLRLPTVFPLRDGDSTRGAKLR